MEIKDVESLAALARIELGEEEKKDLLKDMQDILGYVKQIEELKVDVQHSVLDNYNVWREDGISGQDFSKEIIMKQFPDAQDDFLKVKKIL